jgi:hypothetical protein
MHEASARMCDQVLCRSCAGVRTKLCWASRSFGYTRNKVRWDPANWASGEYRIRKWKSLTKLDD